MTSLRRPPKADHILHHFVSLQSFVVLFSILPYFREDRNRQFLSISFRSEAVTHPDGKVSHVTAPGTVGQHWPVQRRGGKQTLFPT